tara:strand:- start:11 stop:280 length:270 start_codon:yes stop_codon:yes gene_type:complete
MTEEKFQNQFRELVDNLLLVNLFSVVFFAMFFIFAVIMQIKGVSIFLEFIQRIWNPLIVPLITILIISSLINGISSWWRRKLLDQEKDI